MYCSRNKLLRCSIINLFRCSRRRRNKSSREAERLKARRQSGDLGVLGDGGG